jgi:endonuclease G, mitochondrial
MELRSPRSLVRRQASLALALALALWPLGTPIALAASVDKAAAKRGVVACTRALQRTHNPNIATKTDHLVCFQAYVSNFNTRSVDMGNGKKRPFAVPHWVIQKVEESDGDQETKSRPGKWFTVPELQNAGLAPNDASYAFSKRFLERRSNWYERGHLAQKFLAERLGGKAGWFTHNVVNAVPQRGKFNRGPWLAVECFTGAWANRYGEVWIVSGPIFDDEDTIDWLISDKNKKALPIAIPNALFKIVARRAAQGEWEALAFIYPQTDKRYDNRPFDPSDWLASIAEIERKTGETFFPAERDDSDFKKQKAQAIWAVDRENFDTSCKQFAPGPNSAARN